jgi:hypothetical protein
VTLLSTRVCYHLQTHTRPAQVAHLVELIKRGSPESVVVITHDERGPKLDIRRLAALPGVHVLTLPGGYGDFSHIDRYFATVDWLDEHGIEFDWMENLTGQDYPLRPIAEIERVLSSTEADGFLQYAPVYPSRTPADVDWGAGPEYFLCSPFDAEMRYDFRHWRMGRPTLAKQRLLRPLMAIDWMQPWLRLSLGHSSIGVRRKRTLFNPDFICYGGSFLCTLSARCVNYLRTFARDNPDAVAFFRTTLGPEEIFFQTVLVNSGQFRLVPDSKRYVDFSKSRNNHCKFLGVADLKAMRASDAHWARKFDPARDAEVLEILNHCVEPDHRS